MSDNPEEDAAKMIAHLYVARILENKRRAKSISPMSRMSGICKENNN
ncbi:MAG: hypothetical protein IPK03_01580 [Bacteroidetes bacterium]|nr:hypothetical protein [Bacteroidota bacterium]